MYVSQGKRTRCSGVLACIYGRGPAPTLPPLPRRPAVLDVKTMLVPLLSVMVHWIGRIMHWKVRDGGEQQRMQEVASDSELWLSK